MSYRIRTVSLNLQSAKQVLACGVCWMQGSVSALTLFTLTQSDSPLTKGRAKARLSGMGQDAILLI